LRESSSLPPSSRLQQIKYNLRREQQKRKAEGCISLNWRVRNTKRFCHQGKEKNILAWRRKQSSSSSKIISSWIDREKEEGGGGGAFAF
jgi:hypothetical protein